ncbi:MAG TPA: AI-2E family transporter [Leptolyngbyaceae cyanobacterium]
MRQELSESDSQQAAETNHQTAQPHISLWEQLSHTMLVKFLLLFACGWAFVEILAYFQVVVIIFVTATILAFLLSHPVDWLNRWMPRGIAAAIVFACSLLVIVAIAVTVGLALLTQGPRLVDSLGEFLNSLQPRIEQLEAALKARNIAVDLQGLEAQFRERALGLIGTGLGLIQAMLANVVMGLLIAVVTLFMLLDGRRIWWWLLKWLPADRRDHFSEIVQRNLLGFFWGRLLLSLFLGSSVFISFLVLKVPFALVLGVFAGLFDLIPGIGSSMGIGLIFFFLLSQNLWLALKALFVCIVIEQIEENILLPHVMRDSLDINPVVMFFALVVGARVAGLLGVFLAIPIAGVIVSWLGIEEMKGRASLAIPEGISSDEVSR